jgi:hypothetical protein
MDKQGTIGLEELKNIVIEQCEKEIEVQKVSKKDVEAFLSSFVYNAYGHTELSKIAPQVFDTYSSMSKIH